ncbi:hypothetical protein RKD23_001391 [Streptomyces sp. SAI-170]|uniref:hypothetical protein n=1 Tax=Streptomyces sp. SAI-170 TaxID=3377729 RepID=UPI003C7C327E
MEPISVALLAALAGGAGGEVGREAWAGLSALVRRRFRRPDGNEDASAVSSGEAELARLADAPDDTTRAHALSTALAVRAALDAEFHAGLRQWRESAERLDTGTVHNSISGGTFSAPVIQGRDFWSPSFTASTAPPTDEPDQQA